MANLNFMCWSVPNLSCSKSLLQQSEFPVVCLASRMVQWAWHRRCSFSVQCLYNPSLEGLKNSPQHLRKIVKFVPENEVWIDKKNNGRNILGTFMADQNHLLRFLNHSEHFFCSIRFQLLIAKFNMFEKFAVGIEKSLN